MIARDPQRPGAADARRAATSRPGVPPAGPCPQPARLRSEPHPAAAAPDADRSLPLAHDHRLTISRGPHPHTLSLLGPDGAPALSIEITAHGPVLRFERGLTIAAAGDLTLQAERLNLHGRAGVALTSDGDLDLAAAGRFRSAARSQQISATLGDVRLQANDDVRFNGERVLVNCTLPEVHPLNAAPPPLFSHLPPPASPSAPAAPGA
ncbi:hypothetical protein BH11PLA1_BH11PLA1_17930 [soil metagenome]